MKLVLLHILCASEDERGLLESFKHFHSHETITSVFPKLYHANNEQAVKEYISLV